MLQSLHSEGFGQKAERNKKKNGCGDLTNAAAMSDLLKRMYRLPTKEEASREKKSWGKKAGDAKPSPRPVKKARKEAA